MDNLKSQTYEVFEKDPVKYALYEKAIFQALLDMKKDDSYTYTLMVVGAGRGPLVKAALRAGKKSRKRLRIYAVEKNPNAVVTLRNLKAHFSISRSSNDNSNSRPSWGWEIVTIVDSDMRHWDAPEKADILVSELLGSFGDNELSPECLDGAQRFLKDDGISIPCEYTSYVAPLTSSKIYNDVKLFGDITHFETAYVVKVHNARLLSPPQACFRFVHPNPRIRTGGTSTAKLLCPESQQYPSNNARHTAFQFECTYPALMHGFVGYFDSKLYKNVHISIHPQTHTQDLISWFPIFFPLSNPVYVPKNSVVDAHFWRNITQQKVWYEWCITAPMPTPIQNPNGRSYWIGT